MVSKLEKVAIDLTLIFPRGENGGAKLLDHWREFYKVRMYSAFAPTRSGQADDQLVLSAMIQRCGIAGADGGFVELFPEKASA